MTRTWTNWTEGFDAEMRAANRPSTTRELRRYHLRRLASEYADVEPGDITRIHLIEFLGSRPWSAETRRSYRASYRLFYRWAHATGRIAVDPAATLPPITPPRGMPRPAPDTALREAIAVADDRTRLMIELVADTGIRRFECAQCRTTDVVRDLDGWSLRVIGKGGRERSIPLPDVLAATLRRQQPGYLFPGQIDGHLSARRVGELIADALPDHWTAHTLRHRYATLAYQRTGDLRAVQELLGHAKPETTARYTLVAAPTLRAVASTVWTTPTAA